MECGRKPGVWDAADLLGLERRRQVPVEGRKEVGVLGVGGVWEAVAELGVVWGGRFGRNVPQQLRPSLDRAPGPCPVPGLTLPAPADQLLGRRVEHCSLPEPGPPVRVQGRRTPGSQELVGLKDGETLEGKDGMERLRETPEAEREGQLAELGGERLPQALGSPHLIPLGSEV